MRPKAFPRTPAGGWLGDYAQAGDTDLDPELARTLQTFRRLSWSVEDNPSRADVRETLRRLSEMTPEEAAQRWPDVDDTTEAEIERAQLELVGRVGPPLAIVLPELARHALDTIGPKWRPPVGGLAVMLAAALAAHWWRLKGTRPPRRPAEHKTTPFVVWAHGMFKRAGYPTGDLLKQLGAGVRAAEQDGRIPRR